MNVLVIDDDAALVASYTRLLTVEGHRATSAATVSDALAELAATTPDLVLLDYHLDRDPQPLHDALTRRGLPVILASGEAPDTLAATATALGWSYLGKPFSGVALRAEMARLVSSDAPSQRAAVATKSTAQIIAETIVDLVAIAVIASLLWGRRVQSEWLQALLVVGLLLLAGVRVADLRALARGLPSQGGVAAVLLASSGAIARYLGDRV
jgi:DNA-binding response OmpR family regulator